MVKFALKAANRDLEVEHAWLGEEDDEDDDKDDDNTEKDTLSLLHVRLRGLHGRHLRFSCGRRQAVSRARSPP